MPEPAEDAGTPPFSVGFWEHPDRLEALLHPLRVRAYVEAVKAPVSAKELADRLGVPLQRMSYHVRHLADAGLLTVVSRTPRRGAVETHYRAVATLELDTSRFLDRPELFQTWYRIIHGLIAEDIGHAIEQGAGQREDFVMTRAHLCVDAEGRERLEQEVLGFYDRLAALAEELKVAPDAGGEELNVVLVSYEGSREGGRNGPIWTRLTGEHDRETIPKD